MPAPKVLRPAANRERVVAAVRDWLVECEGTLLGRGERSFITLAVTHEPGGLAWTSSRGFALKEERSQRTESVTLTLEEVTALYMAALAAAENEPPHFAGSTLRELDNARMQLKRALQRLVRPAVQTPSRRPRR